MSPEEVEAELRQIYSLIPDAHCKGLCADQCTVIAVQAPELSIMPPVKTTFTYFGRLVIPVKNPAGNNACPFLKAGRCSIYNDRPFVCRAYAAVENHGKGQLVQCRHGCKPDRPITEAESDTILQMILDLERRMQEGA